MTETTIINVLPCRDVAPQTVEIEVTSGTLQPGTFAVLDWKSKAQDAIGQDVVVGDVLWRDGRFCLVDGLDVTLNKAHLDNVIGNWAGLSEAIRCPRPGESMPYFAHWDELKCAMAADGAKFYEPIYWSVSHPNANWVRRHDCAWRKPHPGAESRVVDDIIADHRAATIGEYSKEVVDVEGFPLSDCDYVVCCDPVGCESLKKDEVYKIASVRQSINKIQIGYSVFDPIKFRRLDNLPRSQRLRLGIAHAECVGH